MAEHKNTLKWQNVYVFISSTFNDMHAERDYLIKSVFPKLSEWCMERKLRLVDIDLRWGITSEESDSLNNKVVEICLDNIDKCRPFFLCFLGQRRGWVPEKEDVALSTYEKIVDIDGSIGKSSVTELEIMHALINPFEIKDSKTGKVTKHKRVRNALFLFRNSSYLDDMTNSYGPLLNIYTNALAQSPEKEDQILESFKNQLKLGTMEQVHKSMYEWNEYCCDFDKNQRTPELKSDKLGDSLCQGRLTNFRIKDDAFTDLKDYIFEGLTKAIEKEFPENCSEKMDMSGDDELVQQEEFLHRNLHQFVGRNEEVGQLLEYVGGESKQPLLVYANAGVGKTVLMANIIKLLSERGERICYRFCGVGDKSIRTQDLLSSIAEELHAGNCFDTDKIENEMDMSITGLINQPKQLIRFWKKIMKCLKSKITIVIDSVNELEETLDSMAWIPNELSADSKMVISCKALDNEKGFLRFQNRFNNLMELNSFSSLDIREQLIDEFLATYLKKLSDTDKNELLKIDATENPLYLKILLSELRIYGSFDNLRQEIYDFGDTSKSAFNKVLRRMEEDADYIEKGVYNADIVKGLFGLMAYSRNGLESKELIAGIGFSKGLDPENEAIKEKMYEYIRQMRDYLVYHGKKLSYFYESFKLATQERYQSQKKEFHSCLAKVYRNKLKFNEEDRINAETVAAYRELTYHLHASGQDDEIERILLNYSFLYNKIRICGIDELLLDFNYISEQNEAIVQLQNALERSKHAIDISVLELPTFLYLWLGKITNQQISSLLKDLEGQTNFPWLKPLSEYCHKPENINKVSNILIDEPEDEYMEYDICHDWQVIEDSLYILINRSEEVSILEIWDLKPSIHLKERIWLSERILFKNNYHDYDGRFSLEGNYLNYSVGSHYDFIKYRIDMELGEIESHKIMHRKNKSVNKQAKDLKWGMEFTTVKEDKKIALGWDYYLEKDDKNDITVYDMTNGELLCILKGHRNHILYMECYKDVIISVSALSQEVDISEEERQDQWSFIGKTKKEVHVDIQLIFWDKKSGKKLEELNGVNYYSYKDGYLLTMAPSALKIWDLNTMELIHESGCTIKNTHGLKRLHMEGTKELLVISDRAGLLLVYNKLTHKMTKPYRIIKEYYKGREESFNSRKICGNYLYVELEDRDGASKYPRVDMWNMLTEECVNSIEFDGLDCEIYYSTCKDMGMVQVFEFENSWSIIDKEEGIIKEKIYRKLNYNDFIPKIAISKDIVITENESSKLEISLLSHTQAKGFYAVSRVEVDENIIYIDDDLHNMRVWGKYLKGEEFSCSFPIPCSYTTGGRDSSDYFKVDDDLLIIANLEKDRNKFICLTESYDKYGMRSWEEGIRTKNENYQKHECIENDIFQPYSAEENVGFFGWPLRNTSKGSTFEFEERFSIYLDNIIVEVYKNRIKVLQQPMTLNPTALFEEDLGREITLPPNGQAFRLTRFHSRHNRIYQILDNEVCIFTPEGDIRLHIDNFKIEFKEHPDFIPAGKNGIIGEYTYKNYKIWVLRDKIHVWDYEKNRCIYETNHNMLDNGSKGIAIRGYGDGKIWFMNTKSICVLDLSDGKLNCMKIEMPEHIERKKERITYLRCYKYVYIWLLEDDLYAWDFQQNCPIFDEVNIEGILRDECRAIEENQEFITYKFSESEFTLDILTKSITVKKYYPEHLLKTRTPVKIFDTNYSFKIWVFEDVLHIRDEMSKECLFEGEHGLNLDELVAEDMEILALLNEIWILTYGGIIVYNRVSSSIRKSISYIKPKYLKEVLEQRLGHQTITQMKVELKEKFTADKISEITQDGIIYIDIKTLENLILSIPVSFHNVLDNGNLLIMSDGNIYEMELKHGAENLTF
ncbi:MAG: DUF4062 domain-containing protein [Tissierellales bacterium]